MKISGCTNLNLNFKQPAFKAGKTTLYTDFDGTYFPFSQDSIIYEDKFVIKSANNMYSALEEFKETAKEKFSTIITTGRSRLEMKTVLEDLDYADVSVLKPDGYIFRDGTDEIYINNDTDSEETVNPDFIKDLKKLTGITKKINKNITTIRSKTNKNIHNDCFYSLEALFKEIPAEQQKEYVSFVAENDKMIEMVFPPDIDTAEYEEKIKQYYEGNETPVSIVSYKNDKNFWVPVYNEEAKNGYDIKPGNVILIKYMKDGIVPDKLNQPKKAVKDIVENNSNDLIIVAGDGSNDKSMLNPLNYIDIFGINKDDEKSLEDFLSDEKVLSALKDLPLISIIAGDGKGLEDIVRIKKILDGKKIRKIFIAKNPDNDLLAKIKNGMYVHCENNDDYKFGLGFKLYGEILG